MASNRSPQWLALEKISQQYNNGAHMFPLVKEFLLHYPLPHYNENLSKDDINLCVRLYRLTVRCRHDMLDEKEKKHYSELFTLEQKIAQIINQNYYTRFKYTIKNNNRPKDHPEIRLTFSDDFIRENKFDEAEKVLDTFKNINEIHTESNLYLHLYQSLARFYTSKGHFFKKIDFDQSQEYYSQASKYYLRLLNTSRIHKKYYVYFPCIIGLAHTLSLQDRYEEAIPLLEKLINSDTFAHATQRQKAIIHHILDISYFSKLPPDFKKAKEHSILSKQADPKYAPGLSEAAKNKPHVNNARKLYEEARHLDPQRWEKKHGSEVKPQFHTISTDIKLLSEKQNANSTNLTKVQSPASNVAHRKGWKTLPKIEINNITSTLQTNDTRRTWKPLPPPSTISIAKLLQKEDRPPIIKPSQTFQFSNTAPITVMTSFTIEKKVDAQQKKRKPRSHYIATQSKCATERTKKRRRENVKKRDLKELSLEKMVPPKKSCWSRFFAGINNEKPTTETPMKIPRGYSFIF